jgi:hypothetical protein
MNEEGYVAARNASAKKKRAIFNLFKKQVHYKVNLRLMK